MEFGYPTFPTKGNTTNEDDSTYGYPYETENHPVGIESVQNPTQTVSTSSPISTSSTYLLSIPKGTSYITTFPSNISPFSTTSSNRELYLFIQMHLCSHTLQDYLSSRNAKFFENNEKDRQVSTCIDPEECWDIFCQVMSGVRCIHSKMVIHRDIKVMKISCTFFG